MTTRKILPWPFKADTLVAERYRVTSAPGMPTGIVKKGGMGVLYRVEDLEMERTCVLKTLQPRHHPLLLPEHDARALLEREAKVQSRLRSANNSDSFVTVFERGTVYVHFAIEGGSESSRSPVELDLPYYTMELLDGYDLEQLIDYYQAFKQLVPWEVVLAMSAQAARALSIAHESGIIHRDIKPNNLYVHERVDRAPVLKYIDFGVCTQQGEPGVLPSTTKRYGPPELLRQSTIRPTEDSSSDIYSLSLVIYEITSLLHPFVEHQHQFAYAHLHLPAPPLRSRRADTPAELDELIARGLDKRPENRPSAEEMAKVLERLQSGSARAADAQIAEVLGKIRVSKRGRAARTSSLVGAGAERRQPGVTDPGRIGAAVSDVLLTHAVPAPPPVVVPPRHETKPFGDGLLAPPVVRELGGNALSALDAAASSNAFTTRHTSTDVGRRALVNDTDPDGPPVFSEPLTVSVPRSVEEDIGVVSSMASAYAAWEDTSYLSSPFQERTLERPRGTVETSVAVAHGEASHDTEDPLVASSMPHAVPLRSRAWVLAVACGSVVLLGAAWALHGQVDRVRGNSEAIAGAAAAKPQMVVGGVPASTAPTPSVTSGVPQAASGNVSATSLVSRSVPLASAAQTGPAAAAGSLRPKRVDSAVRASKANKMDAGDAGAAADSGVYDDLITTLRH